MLKKHIKLLEKWAKQFSKEEWEKLCQNKDFNQKLFDDIEAAIDIAENILKQKVKKINEK